jgi:hypothetical protein
MLKNPIDTPQQLLLALRQKSVSLPDRSRCESFAAADNSLTCLLCTAMALRGGAHCLVIALTAPVKAIEKVFLDRLEQIIHATRIKIPKMDVICFPDMTIVLASWVYRGEIRALVASTIASYAQPLPASVPSSLFSSSLPQDDLAGNMDVPALKRSLCHFASAFDSVWRQSLRRVIKFEDRARWVFPLGCRVQEVVTYSGVAWEMEFSDVELIERAYVLVERRLDCGKAESLDICQHSINPMLDTQMPVLRLRSKINSRESRMEMARLLQNVLVVMDRMTLRESFGALNK